MISEKQLKRAIKRINLYLDRVEAGWRTSDIEKVVEALESAMPLLYPKPIDATEQKMMIHGILVPFKI